MSQGRVWLTWCQFQGAALTKFAQIIWKLIRRKVQISGEPCSWESHEKQNKRGWSRVGAGPSGWSYTWEPQLTCLRNHFTGQMPTKSLGKYAFHVASFSPSASVPIFAANQFCISLLWETVHLGCGSLSSLQSLGTIWILGGFLGPLKRAMFHLGWFFSSAANQLRSCAVGISIAYRPSWTTIQVIRLRAVGSMPDSLINGLSLCPEGHA